VPHRRIIRRDITPEELRGLPYAEYIRESTPEQGDKFGPDAQRRANREFAQRYGLVNSGLKYEEYSSGRDVVNRPLFQQARADMEAGKYRILIVAYSDRLARNAADAEQFKAQVRAANGFIVYSSLGMVSGQRSTALAEGVFHVLDAQYSEDVSLKVTDGLREKFVSGGCNGVPPLGSKHKYLRADGTSAEGPERNTTPVRVLDAATLPTLIAVLTRYSKAGSCRGTAEWLNAQGHLTKRRRPFTQDSVKEIIRNPYFGPDEVVIYHKGDVDEARRLTPVDEQIFPEEVHQLWSRCQEKKGTRSSRAAAARSRIYPLHEVLTCATCESQYNGQPRYTAGGDGRHSVHKRRDIECGTPSRVKSEVLEGQLMEVLNGVQLPHDWASQLRLLIGQPRTDDHVEERTRIQTAIKRIKDQHKWGVIDDAEFLKDFRQLQAQLDSVPSEYPTRLDDYRIPADLLKSVGSIVGHPALRTWDDGMRLIKQFCDVAFSKVEVDRARIVRVHPKDQYRDLFAVALANEKREFVCGREDSNLHGCYPTWT
jgi:DNA invertase Pin-like site-specific DNA recombinase